MPSSSRAHPAQTSGAAVARRSGRGSLACAKGRSILITVGSNAPRSSELDYLPFSVTLVFG